MRKVATPQAKVGSPPTGMIVCGSPSPKHVGPVESRVRKTQSTPSKNATPVKTPEHKKGRGGGGSGDVAPCALNGRSPADADAAVACLKYLGTHWMS